MKALALIAITTAVAGGPPRNPPPPSLPAERGRSRDRNSKLRPQLGSTIRWRAKQSGLVQLAVKSGGQSAGYLARLRVY